jgi:hypothetical protein
LFRDLAFLITGAREEGELSMDSKSQYKSYTKPVVEDLGDLVELTAHQQDGNFTDQDFPAGTPKGSLTFS